MSVNNDESIKTLLILLEKAEQILGIINLSDSTINKYNQLKELTFEKLNLDFKPLIKRAIGGNKNFSKDGGESLNMVNDTLARLRSLNLRKNLIIEFLFDIIDKFKFENNSNMKQYLLDNQNFNLPKALDKVNSPIKINLSDLEFEMKLDEIKLKDFVGKSEINYKKLLTNFKSGMMVSHSIDKKNFSSIYMTSEENMSIGGNVDEIIRDYERKIEEMRKIHEMDIREYRERFNEMRTKYNPELENEIIKLKNDLDEKHFLIEKINELLVPVYDKYYQKNISWYENERIDFKYVELERINFAISLVNKFFSDNKYLIDLVSTLQKEKANIIEERNLPFVQNAIEKNNLLNEIYNDIKVVDKNSENFHKNFEELIEFINNNFDFTNS